MASQYPWDTHRRHCMPGLSSAALRGSCSGFRGPCSGRGSRVWEASWAALPWPLSQRGSGGRWLPTQGWGVGGGGAGPCLASGSPTQQRDADARFVLRLSHARKHVAHSVGWASSQQPCEAAVTGPVSQTEAWRSCSLSRSPLDCPFLGQTLLLIPAPLPRLGGRLSCSKRFQSKDWSADHPGFMASPGLT